MKGRCSVKKLILPSAVLAVIAVAGLSAPADARVFIGFSVPLTVGPPPPPPPPVAYAPGYAPGPGYVWVPGYRNWNGYSYSWVGGRWAYPPRPGRVWVGPAWVRGPGGWVWGRGHWR